MQATPPPHMQTQSNPPMQVLSMHNKFTQRRLCIGLLVLPWGSDSRQQIDQREYSWTKSRVFLLFIHSHLYSFALRFLFLQTHATSYSFCKGEKPDRKPYPLRYGVRNPYRNLKSENSHDYALETSMKVYVHESASGWD